MRAKDIMSTKIFKVKAEQDFNVVEVLADIRHVRHIVVVDDEDFLEGVVSIRDMLEHLSVATSDRFAPIKKIMSKNVHSASPETGIFDVARILHKEGIGCLPIVVGRKVVGIVSERDLVRVMAEGGLREA